MEWGTWTSTLILAVNVMQLGVVVWHTRHN